MVRSTAWRALGAVAAFSVVATALIGFAHMPAGRPLLRLLGHASKAVGATCPLGFDRATTPTERRARRRGFAQRHAGALDAAQRPARGFSLDLTTKDEVVAWAATNHAVCKTGKVVELDCSTSDDGSLFTFDENAKLVELVSVRRMKTADAASEVFTADAKSLDARVGEASRLEGDAAPSVLGHGLLRQASAEYRFRDYYALLRATNMGDGFVITEEYRSLLR